MSNALCSAIGLTLSAAGTTAPASAPSSGSGTVSYFMIIILVLGLFAATVVVTGAIARPKLLSLRNTPGRRNRLNILHVLGILAFVLILLPAIIDLAAQGILNVNLEQLAKDEPTSPLLLELMVIKSMIVPAAMFLISLAAAKATFVHGLSRGMGLRTGHWICDTMRGVVGFLAVMPPCLGLLWITTRFTPEQVHPLLVTLRTASPPLKVGIFIAAGVLAPLAEETFFRGMLQSYIRAATGGGAWQAIVIASTVFTAMHVPQYSAMPSLMLLAVVLGFTYEKSGRLLTPIILHSLFNMANMIAVLAGD